MLTFYREWLSLPKKEFKILMVLARDGGFKGNLSDLCRRYGLTPQDKNRKKLRSTIEALAREKYITSSKSGNTYIFSTVPQETEIKVDEDWFDAIVKREKFSVSVSKEAVIKVLLWMIDRGDLLYTGEEAGADLAISESTFGVAKKVLVSDFGAAKVEVIRADRYHTLGQVATLSAFLYEKNRYFLPL